MMKGILLAMTASAVPMAAAAGDGWYFGVEGGANFSQDQKFKIYDFDTLLGGVEDGTTVSDNSFDTGYVLGALGGYRFASGLRLELEIARRNEEIDKVELESGPSERVEGEEDTDIAMANAWFDFGSGRFHPYIGGGIGAARIDISDPVIDSTVFTDGALRDDDDTVLAYQAGAGVGFDVTPQLTASLDYRYLRSDDGEFDLLPNNPESHVETKYESHAALLSLRYYFRTPPPPPPPEPEPVAVVPVEEPPPPPPPPPPCLPPAPGQAMNLEGCKSGDIIVLRGVNFEFDKATLDANARTILDQVSDALTRRPDVKVELQGHTDGKGSDAYNQRLSEQRAASVVQYLQEHGIDATRMTSVGLGETMPISDNETDEGRELNRRVELKVTEIGEGAAAPVVDASSQATDTTTLPAEAAPADAASAPVEPAAPAEPVPVESAPADAAPVQAEPVNEPAAVEAAPLSEPAPEEAMPAQ